MQPLVTPGSGPIPGVPQHQPSNLFRFGEITLYSTVQLVAGAIANTNQRLFTTPLGQTGQGYAAALTVSETNLKEGGRIPSGQAYDVFGVACQVMGMTADNGTMSVPFNTDGVFAAAPGNVSDLQNVVNNGVLVWDFTQTQVFISPVMLAGAGGGVYGSVAATTTVAATSSSLGAMNNGNGGIWMYRKHPVALPGSSTFAVEIQFGARAAAIATATAMRVVLLGYYKSVIEIG